MSIQKVNEIFVGNGTNLDGGGTAFTSIAAQIAIVGTDMTCLASTDTIATANRGSIYFVNKYSDGTFKRSMPIKGTSVTGYKGETFRPATRMVTAIGYDRKAATGSIVVNADTFYAASIIFKNDKDMFSERPERLSIEFTSSTTATQSSIADQIVNAINNSAYGSSATGIKVVKAVKVGDGTGVYGLTGAANYGVEIWGLDVNQFANTTYQANYVYFTSQVDDATGFDTTSTSVIQYMDSGAGTYNGIYNMENKFLGTEGALNRRLWPIPTYTLLAVDPAVTSGTLAAFTVTGTSGEDKLTFSAAASTQLPAGSKIVVSGNTYEIKYYISTTVAILTSVLLTSPAATAVSAKAGYDVISVSFTDTTYQDGAGVGQFSTKTLYIATPTIASGATSMTAAASAEGAAILAILNTWMPSTPLNPPTVSI